MTTPLLSGIASASLAIAGESIEGEEPAAAWIVVEPETDLTDEVLMDHIASQLAPHKRPRLITRVNELPRNALGKVQKRRLMQ